jgi:hypothetical protein
VLRIARFWPIWPITVPPSSKFECVVGSIYMDIIPVRELFDRANIYDAIVEMTCKLWQILPLVDKKGEPVKLITRSNRKDTHTIQR